MVALADARTELSRLVTLAEHAGRAAPSPATAGLSPPSYRGQAGRAAFGPAEDQGGQLGGRAGGRFGVAAGVVQVDAGEPGLIVQATARTGENVQETLVVRFGREIAQSAVANQTLQKPTAVP
ncbi:hypothetical protein ACFVUN_23325 [Kitasatospora griseola]|uniref:hypothetical protein n=1 Tax=Kitasatospora griseola TaxID=2064 RepID=UPI0036D7EC52